MVIALGVSTLSDPRPLQRSSYSLGRVTPLVNPQGQSYTTVTLFHVVCVRPVLTNAAISFLLLMECLRTHSADRLFHSVVFQPRCPHVGTSLRGCWLMGRGYFFCLLDPGTTVLSKYSCDGQLALSDGVVSLCKRTIARQYWLSKGCSCPSPTAGPNLVEWTIYKFGHVLRHCEGYQERGQKR